MNEQHVNGSSSRAGSITTWEALLQDRAALLKNPGAHHKTLLKSAHMLHQAHIIDREGLSDLLEQADGALAYAVEELLDLSSSE